MIKTKFGNNLAKLRRAAEMTQEDLAEKASYSVEFVSYLERGVHAPSLEGMERLAMALGVEMFELFEFGGDTK